MNALVDADVHHIIRHIRKAVIRNGSVDRGAGHREGRPVAEEVLERARHGARQVVRPRRVIRIGRRGEEREPGRVAGRSGIAVVLPFLDGGDGAPEEVQNFLCPMP